MIINIPHIISEVMTTTPQAPVGTSTSNLSDQPLKKTKEEEQELKNKTKEEEIQEKRRNNITTANYIGALARPFTSPIAWSVASGLGAAAVNTAISKTAQGIGALYGKLKGVPT